MYEILRSISVPGPDCVRDTRDSVDAASPWGSGGRGDAVYSRRVGQRSGSPLRRHRGARRRCGAEAGKRVDKHRIGRLFAGNLATDYALLQEQDTAGQLGDEVEVLLHQHNGQPAPAVEFGEQRSNVVHDRGLDALGRFVEQYQLGFGDEAAGDREKLLLATGQRSAVTIEEVFQARKFVEYRPNRGVLVAVAVGCDPHAKVVTDGEIGKDPTPLRHIADSEMCPVARSLPREVESPKDDRAIGGGDDTHDRLEQRGLSHAIVPKNADDLRLVHREIDAVQNGHTPVAGIQARDLKQCAHGGVLMPGAPGRPRGHAGRPQWPPSCPP